MQRTRLLLAAVGSLHHLEKMSQDMKNLLGNETLNILTEYYPNYIPYVPKEVLAFGGLPNPYISALAALFSLLLSATSLTGNLTLILLYFRYVIFKISLSNF